MRRMLAATVAVASGLALSGCATKQYGRLQPLSSYEMANYNCRDIAIELSKVDAFDEQVRDQARFDGKSALGVLGDFGVGNAMAKSGAEKSSIERRRQLETLSAQKGCTTNAEAGTATAPPAPAAAPAATTAASPAPAASTKPPSASAPQANEPPATTPAPTDGQSHVSVTSG